MRKLFSFLLLLIFSLAWGFAYTPFSEQEHAQIDQRLNQPLSKKEKKEKSDFFSRLAQKSLAIRKAFLPNLKAKLYWPALRAEDLASIEDRVRTYQNFTTGRREEMLEELLKTQQISEEISRSLQIESFESFEGYAKTILPTPVFWLPIDQVDINLLLGWPGTTGLKLDSNNLIQESAVVLPPWTVVSLMKKVDNWIFTTYQIRTREFDAGRWAKYGYFLDSRFIQKVDQKPAEKIQLLPSLEQVKKNLLAASGTVYVWGGSWWQGIPEIEKFFPSATGLTTLETKRKLFQGVDCSGLLYQATNWYTPRNTRSLLNFWKPVPIAGKTIDQIVKILKPLDIIVWDWHIVIVLDEKRTIESRWRGQLPGGVEIVDTKKRLEEIFKTRSPVDNYYDSKLANHKKFVIRRWI